MDVTTHDVAVATWAIDDMYDLRKAADRLIGLCILAGVPLSDILAAIEGE